MKEESCVGLFFYDYSKGYPLSYCTYKVHYVLLSGMQPGVPVLLSHQLFYSKVEFHAYLVQQMRPPPPPSPFSVAPVLLLKMPESKVWNKIDMERKTWFCIWLVDCTNVFKTHGFLHKSVKCIFGLTDEASTPSPFSVASVLLLKMPESKC
jgi:hypothetical protein